MRVVLCHISLSLVCFFLFGPYCLSMNVSVSFQLAEVVSLLCLYLDRGHIEGQYGGEEPVGQDKIFYILGDSALLGDYKGFNWRMKESKVVSDISGLGIWQSAA